MALLNWLRPFLDFRVLILFFLGLAAALPLGLIYSTPSLWLAEAGVAKEFITPLSWALLAYSFKFTWAPFIDGFSLPWLGRWLGRRRGWLLFFQALIFLLLLAMGQFDPALGLAGPFSCAALLALCSASQDIVIDGYRIDLTRDNDALATATIGAYLGGYRLGYILSTAGSLFLASYLGSKDNYHFPAWRDTYRLMALVSLLGLFSTLLAPRLTAASTAAAVPGLGSWLNPVKEFLQRYGRRAWLLLALVVLYRLAGILLGSVSNLFYRDLGFSKEQIAAAAKTFGMAMTLLGGFIGAPLVQRFGLGRLLFHGALWSAATNLLFIALNQLGPQLYGFYALIALDNLVGGLANAVFLSFLSSLTSIKFTAVQYALFSSLMTLLPKILAGYGGALVEHMGYNQFFFISFLIGLPILLLIKKAEQKL